VVAIVATYDSILFVGNVEKCCHGFVVGDALRIVAAYEPTQVLGQTHLPLFNDLIVTYYGEGNIGRNNRELVHFFVSEEAVGYFYDALRAHLVGLEVEAYRDLGRHLIEVEKIDNLEKSVAWNVVNYRSVVES